MNKEFLLLLLCALSMLSIARAEIPQPLVDAQWLAENQASVVILDSLRIDMDDSLILYCNSAYECASDWFVLHEILGKQDVRVYDGSLHQWTQYESNPMTTRLSD